MASKTSLATRYFWIWYVFAAGWSLLATGAWYQGQHTHAAVSLGIAVVSSIAGWGWSREANSPR